MIAPIGRFMRADGWRGRGRALGHLCCALTALSRQARSRTISALRGSDPSASQPIPNWSGFYGGGDVGFCTATSISAMRAGTSPISPAQYRRSRTRLSDPSSWPVLGSRRSNRHVSAASSVTICNGRTSFSAPKSTTPIRRVRPSAPSTPMAHFHSQRIPAADTTVYDIDGSGRPRCIYRLRHVPRARRLGGEQHFLPYGFFGFAVGRADYSSSPSLGVRLQRATDLSPDFTVILPAPAGFRAAGVHRLALRPATHRPAKACSTASLPGWASISR